MLAHTTPCFEREFLRFFKTYLPCHPPPITILQTGFTGSLDEEVEKILDEVDKNGECKSGSRHLISLALGLGRPVLLQPVLVSPGFLPQATAKLTMTSLWH